MSFAEYNKTERAKKHIRELNLGGKINLGRKHSLITKEKHRIATLKLPNAFKKGQLAWNKGISHNLETRIKISRTRKLKVKEKSSNWKGGTDSRTRVKYAPRPKPEQCELCGIFGKDLKRGLCFDHDHKTGKFRGWICGRCNCALGFVKDSSELLLKMVEYLKNGDKSNTNEETPKID